MRLGDLRHSLRLERPAEGAPDSYGQPPEGWEPVGEVFAKVEPLSMRELELARQQDARATHRLTIRFHPEVTTRTRFLYGDRVLNVVSVLDVEERHDVVQVLAQEVVS